MRTEAPAVAYFMLRLHGGKQPAMLEYQIDRGGVWISASTKAADHSKGACLDSQALADSAAAAQAPAVLRRYGAGARLEAVPCWAPAMKGSVLPKRIEADSAMLRARIAQGVFAPNMQPVF